MLQVNILTTLLAGLIASIAIPETHAVSSPHSRYRHVSSINNLINAVSASTVIPTIDYIIDDLFNFQIRNPGASVMTGKSITVYYVFYGENFSDLEIDRITNYAKHISDADTKPDRWSVAKRYYDSNGNYVTKPLLYGGHVVETDYSFERDVAKILTLHIGNGKTFPYDSHGIYTLVTPPEVAVQDCPDPLCCYGGDHFSFNATIDNETKLVNHAFCPALLPEVYVGPVDIAPNGDTGRQVVEYVVDALHHEFFESMSDPQVKPFKTQAWNDVSLTAIGVNGDACEYYNAHPGLRFTESTLHLTGQLQHDYQQHKVLTQFKTFGDSTKMESSHSTRHNEFKSINATVNIVTAADCIKGYNGPVNVPCKGFLRKS
ncbi:hypothetical protein HDU76_010084, partial [Blyttiomyces sp. JEL0837]